MDDRQRMIAEFMKDNPEKCSYHGGYESYMRTKEILDKSSLPRNFYIKGIGIQKAKK